MIQERRAWQRIKSQLFIQYSYDENGQKWDITTIKDMSPIGVCIQTGQVFDQGRPILLKMKIPSRPFEMLQVKGKVVDSKPEEASYTTRISFLEMSADNKKTLEEYVMWILKNEKK